MLVLRMEEDCQPNVVTDTCLFQCCFLITALALEIHSKAEFLAVRMDFDIPPEEKEFVKKRKVVTAQAMQKLLGLESEPQPETVDIRLSLTN